MKNIKMKRFKFNGWSELEKRGLEYIKLMWVCEDEEEIVAFNEAIKLFEKAGFEEVNNNWKDEEVLECVELIEWIRENGKRLFDNVNGDYGVLIDKIKVNNKEYFIVDTPNGINVVDNLKKVITDDEEADEFIKNYI